MHNILQELTSWSLQVAEALGYHVQNPTLLMVSGDASFRQYYRLECKPKSLIIVFSPPDKEDNRSFIAIAKAWHAQGLHVPQVHQTDESRGFMALSDLGSRLLLPDLNDSSVDQYYQQALRDLDQLAATTPPDDYPLPTYDADKLRSEMQLFVQWFCTTHLSLTELSFPLESLYELLIDSAVAQPQVVVHRDYHARNLMLDGDQLGIIDFQDAVIGPITYDPVSLLKDCYIAWPRSRVEAWVKAYNNQSRQPIDNVMQAFDFMGLQRHIKVAGIFARLYHRDKKAGYLNDLPLVLAYLVDAAQRYSSTQGFADWLKASVLPRYFELTPSHQPVYEQHLETMSS